MNEDPRLIEGILDDSDPIDRFENPNSRIDHELEKIEEELEMEPEDSELNVEDVDAKKVLWMSNPRNLLFAIRFFQKYIKLQH